jgi:hypothetical protein
LLVHFLHPFFGQNFLKLKNIFFFFIWSSWGQATREMVGEILCIEGQRVRIKFPTITREWCGHCSELVVASIVPGMRAQVKEMITEPEFGWNGASHAYIGEIHSFNHDEGMVMVLFPDDERPQPFRMRELHVHEGDSVFSRFFFPFFFTTT